MGRGVTDERGSTDAPDPAAVRDRAVERALERLEERGELTDRQRATVERLADRLVAELLGAFDGEGRALGIDTDDGEYDPTAAPD